MLGGPIFLSLWFAGQNVISAGADGGQAYVGEDLEADNIGGSASLFLSFRRDFSESAALSVELHSATSRFYGPPFFGEDSREVSTAGSEGRISTVTGSFFGYLFQRTGAFWLGAGLGLGVTWEKIAVPIVESSHLYLTATAPSLVALHQLGDDLAIGCEARLMFTDIGSFIDGTFSDYQPRTAGEDTSVFLHVRADFML